MRIVYCFLALMGVAGATYGAEEVIDVPTRAGVTQRFLFLTPAQPKAAAILFAGGHGGLQITGNGKLTWGHRNFLVRNAALLADQGIAVAVLDAPSDRQAPPHLSGFRQSAQHADDVKAVIAWLRKRTGTRVWFIGTSRGTQSAAGVATRVAGNDGPDGLVLTATILNDSRSRAVPQMPLETLKIPVLVVHHEQDACRVTLFSDIPALMQKLAPLETKELVTFRGGADEGPACEAMAYHGFNGLDKEVIERIAAWMLARQ